MIEVGGYPRCGRVNRDLGRLRQLLMFVAQHIGCSEEVGTGNLDAVETLESLTGGKNRRVPNSQVDASLSLKPKSHGVS